MFCYTNSLVSNHIGIKFIFRIVQTEAFRSVNLTYTAPPDPACTAFTYLSDDYWKCIVQQSTQSIYHQVGTCSLGPDSSNSTVSVVDTKFRYEAKLDFLKNRQFLMKF